MFDEIEGVIIPTNNAPLMSFLLSFDVEIFVDEHRPSMRVGSERAKRKMCVQCVRVPTDLPFLHATVGGWVLGS